MSYTLKALIAIAVFVCLHLHCFGQSPKQKVYTAKVATVFRSKGYRGALLKVEESSITILSKGKPVSIPSNSIKSITFKREAAIGRGATLGSITGFGLGYIVGYMSEGENDCQPGTWCIEVSPGEAGLAAGLVLSGAGTIIGVIIGWASKKQKININGDQQIFQSNLEEMRKYVQTHRASDRVLETRDSKEN